MSEFPIRKQIRLSGYDYSNDGYYFVTICTQNKECLFGDITNNKMILNNMGKIIENVWKTLTDRFPIELDTYQIMPNHFHFIIAIVTPAGLPRPTLGQIIGYFKYETTKQINNMFQTGAKMETGRKTRPLHINTETHPVGAGSSRPPIIKIFQRNYYEHIIRNEDELYRIQEYINLNPEMWERDRNNPVRVGFSDPQ